MVKTIQIDLDGVLNTYCGNYDENKISAPRKGVKEFLEKLAKNYQIEIFTVRNIALVEKWLIKNKLDKYITNISNSSLENYLIYFVIISFFKAFAFTA